MAHIQTQRIAGLSMTLNTTAGKSLIIHLMEWDAPTYSLAAPGHVITQSKRQASALTVVEQWFCASAVGGSTTLTFTLLTGATTAPLIFVSEFDPLIALDQQAGANFNAGDTSTPSSGFTPTTQANILLVGAIAMRAGGTMPLLSPLPDTYTIPSNGYLVSIMGGAVEYRYEPNAGTYDAGFTFLNDTAYNSVLVGSYKEAGLVGPQPTYVRSRGVFR